MTKCRFCSDETLIYSAISSLMFHHTCQNASTQLRPPNREENKTKRKPQTSNLKLSLMADLRKPSSCLIFFLISLQISSFFFNLSWAFSPLDNHLIDCGSDDNTIIDNRKFVSDLSNTGSISFSAIQTISLRDQNPSQGSSSIYHTSRVFTRSSSYEFEIKETGFHLVRLHFLPISSSKYNISDALFHVSVPGVLLLSNFSGQEIIDHHQNPVLKEYLIWVDSEKLAISFTPAKKSSFAFINAIEVISAPRDLIADTARFVNSEGIEDINGLMKQSLETVYRVNVGGLKVTPFNDTLWRTWIPDDGYLKLSASSKKVSYSGRIKYLKGGASREVAPDNVYNSARVMANPNVSVPDFNMTWIFPVRLGYRYLVRMHFCDIASLTLNELYFDVYVNGYSAYKDLDLSALTGQMLASPFYADFVVDADKSGELSISIGPSSLSSPARINAILNGLEIMKMSNSKGSLDGELSMDCILKSSPEANGGILVPSVAVMSLLFAALVVMHKKRTEVREYMGWSLLPVDEKPR